MELADIRKEIDGIDDELVRLFVRRLKAADAVAEAKRANGVPVLDSDRECTILTRALQRAGSEFGAEVQILFRALLSVSRTRQCERLGLKAD